MKQFLNKALLGLASVGFAATSMVSCYEGEIYNAGAPDDLQQKIDSIAASQAANNNNNGGGNNYDGLIEDVYSFGATDFSSGWWNQFSKYYVIPDGEKWTAVFNLNINPEASNTYKNFALIIANNDVRGGGNYKEYGAIRFDNQPSGNSEWGEYIDRKCVESTLTFETDTDKGVQKLGGLVTLTIDRSDPEAFTVTMTNGEVTKTYKQKSAIANLNADENDKNICVFLCVEGSYIDFQYTSIEPIGGATSRNDKQPVSMVLNNIPATIVLSDELKFEDVIKTATATIEFEEGVTKEVSAEDLTFSVIPDFTTIGTKTIIASYSTTFKGEGSTKAVIGSFAVNIITPEMAVKLPVRVCGKPMELSILNVVGNGKVVEDDEMGIIFRNEPGTGEINKNYLEIPSECVNACADAKCITLSFKVRNYGKAAINEWAPMFTINNGVDYTFGQMRCGGQLIVNQNGYMNGGQHSTFKGAGWISGNNDWHTVTASFYDGGMTLIIDGELVGEDVADGTEGKNISGFITDLNNTAKTIKLGGGQLQSWQDADQPLEFADVEISNKPVTSKALPINELTISVNGVDTPVSKKNIVGAGDFIRDEKMGVVYKNEATDPRSNYLLLPSDLLSHSVDSKAMTITFWAKGDEKTAHFSPIFSAYGAAPVDGKNGLPMFIMQSRGLLQLNNAGWCDFTKEQNVAGQNKESVEHLQDGNWHLISCTLTETSAKYMVDGEVFNEWTVTGTGDGNVIAGLFSNGADLKYICLGGNQAWDWKDVDCNCSFAKLAIYDKALTADEIKALMK